MIACGFQVRLLVHFGKRTLEFNGFTRRNADARDHRPAVSRKNPVHPVYPVHRCESKIYPCLTMSRFSSTRRKRWFQISSAPAPQERADHTRVKHPIVNKGEPRMNTNGHEDQWTSLAAMTSRDEGRERGRPARTTLAQLHPSPRPGSTGNGPTIPLQPSPGRSRRQGDRAPHHGETERPPNPEDAGETPALPEGRLLPSFLLGEEALPLPMRQCRPAWWPFVVLRVPSWITLLSFVSHKAGSGPRRPSSGTSPCSRSPDPLTGRAAEPVARAATAAP